MNIKTVLQQQGVYSPALEQEIEHAIRSNALDVPRARVANPIDEEELEWLEPLNLSPQRRAA